MTFLEDYLTDTINKDGKLREKMSKYVRGKTALSEELYGKVETFLFKQVDEKVKQ